MAQTEGGSIVWKLDADDENLAKGLKRAKKEVDKTAKGISKSFSNAFKEAERSSKIFTGVVVAGLAAVTAAGFKAVEASREQARAEAELVQLHKVNTGATDEQVQSLLDLASATQNVGIVGDEAIIKGQAQLATFRLSTDAIKSLTPAMADMVAQQKGVNATGADFVNIGNLIGKVMEGQIGALGRYGVSFSEAQEEILKTGNEAERAATLAEVLAQNYGGVNEALRNTPEGAMKAATNTLGDMMEIIGSAIDTAILPITTAFNDWVESMGGAEGVMKFLQEQAQTLIDNAPILVGVLIGGMIPAFVALGASIWAALAPLLPFIAAGAALGLAVKLIVDQMGGWQQAMEKIRPVLDFIGKIFRELILPQFQTLWREIQENLLPVLQELWEQLKPTLIPVLKILGAILGGTLLVAITAFVQGLRLVVFVLTEVLEKVTWVTDKIFAAWTWLFNVLVGNSIIPDLVNSIIDWFASLGHRLRQSLSRVTSYITRPFERAFSSVKRIVDKIRDQMEKINPFHRESPSLVDNVKAGLGVIHKEFEQLNNLRIDPIVARATVVGRQIAPDITSDLAFGGAGSSEVNVNVETVNNASDVDSLEREIGFRASIA